jgi:hypothetical protein
MTVTVATTLTPGRQQYCTSSTCVTLLSETVSSLSAKNIQIIHVYKMHLQGTLADHNLAMDKARTTADPGEVASYLQELEDRNRYILCINYTYRSILYIEVALISN